MIYTDEEHERWWRGLSVTEQRVTLDRMLEKADSPSFKTFAESIQAQWKVRNLSAKQIAAVRKWAK